MSSRAWLFRISDIINAIDKTEKYISGMTFAQFKKHDMTVDAVIRNLEVIGEAANAIPKSVKLKYPEIPWKLMSGMRNILIHEYFGVDVSTVWQTAKKNLPSVKKNLVAILEESTPHSSS
ncbi:MAG: DUF86 domain-containing protein [Chlamydiia bacterium]|nr:DUF86 domain-containing protein [Chlamydiia bacterium]